MNERKIMKTLPTVAADGGLQRFSVELEQQEGFEFRVRFDWSGLAERWGEMPYQERRMEQFEDFCVVTESVRAGIPVSVTVVDAVGAVLLGATDAVS